ncbi:type II secretion system F family protein [Aureliella helgolandensis]|uniref:Bacterial type II secretion system protein F domain protein n=1 Tax=Aureliella helgolandensis TaxID=2527968 RepID=A0A518G159_9BACT|nr:type II secretion system F family protein [Aureliella helgolandensis]QDV22333.1 Bacterial type II secretion system protein F domain protein [Aureliella helgolandensis]
MPEARNSVELFLVMQGECLGPAMWGIAIGLLIWIVLGQVTSVRQDASNRYERQRIETLRSKSWVFRQFEPMVLDLGKRLYGEHRHAPDSPFKRGLAVTADGIPWHLPDFWVTKTIEGVLVGLSIFALVSLTTYGAFAAIAGITTAAIYPWLAARSVVQHSARSLKILRGRLPFAIDQISLMMQAGANFEDCLRTLVSDEQGHPLAEEWAIALNEISAGRSRREALLDLRDRLGDQDVAELVFAINKGEELGTPLSRILSEQAEQLRLKRSQWGEKAAAEAEVQIVFPGMLVMLACLLVIVAPILLPAVMNILEQ